MIKFFKTIIFAACCCTLFATSCSNSLTTEEKSKISQMDFLSDTLQQTDQIVDENIESVQKSLNEMDKAFANN